MNVYDFDKTIYRGDSTLHFLIYTFQHCPKTLCNLPRLVGCGLCYVLHLMPKLTFKQNMYHMFVYIDDMDVLVDGFIESHKKNIKEWYFKQQKEDDVVISASNEFIIRPFCNAIGIKYAMASIVDPRNGKYEGLNCHGEEKVRRFYEMFPNGKIDEFYSDSYSDSPLAKLAKKAYLVKGDQLLPWNKEAN